MKIPNTLCASIFMLFSIAATQAKIVTEKGANGYSVTRIIDDAATAPSPKAAVTPAATSIDMVQKASEEGKRDGENAANKEIKTGNISTIIKQCPVSVKSLIKKYGSQGAASAYVEEWGGSFAGTKGRLIDTEAGPRPKSTDISIAMAEVYIKKNLNNPDSFQLTGEGSFGMKLMEFSTPYPTKYDGQWAWKIDRFLFRAENGFGATVRYSATLIIRKDQLLLSTIN
jgi:hypothetical protein